MEKDISLQLLAGLPIEIKNIGKIHQLKLKEIAVIGEQKYNEYLSVISFNKSSLSIPIDDEKQKEEIDKLTDFQIILFLCLQDENFRNILLKSLKFFFKKEVYFDNQIGFFVFGKVKITKKKINIKKIIKPQKLQKKKCKYKKVITENKFNEIKNVIKQSNCLRELEKEEEIKPGNERAKKFIEMLKLKKQNAPKTNDINLISIISSIAWRSHIGINSVWDLTIYQLYDAFYRLDVIDNYDKTLTGIYAGTIDGKKINLKKINWAKFIKI